MPRGVRSIKEKKKKISISLMLLSDYTVMRHTKMEIISSNTDDFEKYSLVEKTWSFSEQVQKTEDVIHFRWQ